MIYSLDELRTGSVVEFNGQLLMIEDLRFRLLGQCINSQKNQHETFMDTGEPAPVPASFMHLEGGVDDPVWENLVPYLPQENTSDPD